MAEMKQTDKERSAKERSGMELERPSLLQPLEEIERLYESIFPHGWLRPFQWERPSWEKARPFFSHRMPAMDMIDRENEIVVRAEVPGVRKEDLSVSLTDNTLTIRGRTEHTGEERREDYYCHEMSYGEFARTISLPAEVDTARVSAKMKDGVLEVALPKREGAKRRLVDVEIA